MTKKIVVLPYFGVFPTYFDLWLSSCENNKSIDWLIITDNQKPNNLSENIRWIEITFAEVKKQFSEKLGINIWLEHPYKLCDYRGCYGYLFSEHLAGYDFWGYCDCDVIFGDIEKFLPESLFEKYDKILRTGHLSFIRNTEAINTNFRKYDTYEIVLSSSVAYAHDEAIHGYHLGFAGELLEQGYRFYQKDELAADIDFRHFPFRVVTSPSECCIFQYREGKLFKLYKQSEQLVQEEVMYVHLQKRKMCLLEDVQRDRYIIYPNVFINEDSVDLESKDFWERISTEDDQYFNAKKEKWDNWVRDFRRLFHEPHKLACLRYRFKRKIN